ncbi:hypothetical protein BC938DRAFT_476869, partial [Jimgerdemannia flammicorona]
LFFTKETGAPPTIQHFLLTHKRCSIFSTTLLPTVANPPQHTSPLEATMTSRTNSLPSSRSSRRQSNRRHDDGCPPVPMTAFVSSQVAWWWLAGRQRGAMFVFKTLTDLPSTHSLIAQTGRGDTCVFVDTLSSRLDDLEHSVHDLDVEMHSDDDDSFVGTSFVKPATEPARPGMMVVPASD